MDTSWVPDPARYSTRSLAPGIPGDRRCWRLHPTLAGESTADLGQCARAIGCGGVPAGGGGPSLLAGGIAVVGASGGELRGAAHARLAGGATHHPQPSSGLQARAAHRHPGGKYYSCWFRQACCGRKSTTTVDCRNVLEGFFGRRLRGLPPAGEPAAGVHTPDVRERYPAVLAAAGAGQAAAAPPQELPRTARTRRLQRAGTQVPQHHPVRRVQRRRRAVQLPRGAAVTYQLPTPKYILHSSPCGIHRLAEYMRGVVHRLGVICGAYRLQFQFPTCLPRV
eukprot:905051-Prorocentrum_minimum.AAC.3